MSTPVSNNSISTTKFGAENLLGSLSEVGFGVERSYERQAGLFWLTRTNPVADQLQHWPYLGVRQLVHQVMQFVSHRVVSHRAHVIECKAGRCLGSLRSTRGPLAAARSQPSWTLAGSLAG
jgi:hypothetical protein